MKSVKTISKGQKRQKKVDRRKNKQLNKKQPAFKTSTEKLMYRVNRAVKQTRTRNYEVIETTQLVTESRERVKELRFLHYYFIFAKKLKDAGVIHGVFNYDVVKPTLMIKSINESLSRLHLLEDEVVTQTELFDIGEKIVTMSKMFKSKVKEISPYEREIYSVMMEMGDDLPKLDNGEEREPWEIENEVLRIVALDYMAEHVFKKELTKGENNE